MPELNPTTQRDHRLNRRKSARTALTLAVRKGTMGLGKDIALSILNLTEDGIGFRAKQELRRGDEIEVILTKRGQNRVMKMYADVCWCCELPNGDPDEPIYAVGARLRKRIPYNDLTTFC